MQASPSLSYDVVKMILELKYKNWLKEKKCVCGHHDFKECDLAECHGCTSAYCRSQAGWDKWMWECRDCFDWFCGNHAFYITPAYRKICEACIGGLYEVPEQLWIEPVPEKQWGEYQKMYKTQWMSSQPAVYNSPEY